jgi:hypothetical protein
MCLSSLSLWWIAENIAMEEIVELLRLCIAFDYILPFTSSKGLSHCLVARFVHFSYPLSPVVSPKMAAGRYDRKLLQVVMRNDIDDDTMTYGPNFTRLDQGDGKHLTLDECPRDQLEKEVGKYLDYVLFSHIYIY